MLSPDTQITSHELPYRLCEPVCTFSEGWWFKFLYTLRALKNQGHPLPISPQQYTVIYYFQQNQYRFTQVWGVQKEYVCAKKYGERTILCLTGSVAGALCSTLDVSNEQKGFLLGKSNNASEVVALRMIRQKYKLPSVQTQALLRQFNVDIYNEAVDWFSQILIQLLNELQWEHDPEQMRANAVPYYELDSIKTA
jgi:hypothetical protein